ncbi:MAG: division/cell wall cluster transcriptional repressor MraZ [Blastochloris sp.]|nr:division/cell wall cluster transcriptional repressor MraZ [Blastochloris sp.]
MQQVYTDTFEHTFDEKGRITVPREWRGEGFESVLDVVPATEGFLRVYPGSFFAAKIQQLAGASFEDPRRRVLEKLAPLIQRVKSDEQNRIMIKDKLRKEAALTKVAVLVGRFDHFEIWDAAKWKSAAVEDASFEQVMREAGL